MDSVNITIAEGQSNNFFSRLQQQINQSDDIASARQGDIQTKRELLLEKEHQKEQAQQQPQPQYQEQAQQQPQYQEQAQQQEKENVKTNDFLSKINSTSKNLGHNKLQLKIDDLESKIEKDKIVEKEQEMKLHLFKKTIATLQSQLQDKAAYISRIESAHIDPQYDRKIQDLTQEIVDLKIKLDNAEGENTQLKLDIDFINNKLETTKLEYVNIGGKNEEVQQRYIVLEQTYQKQANQLQIDLETISRLENKINFELNMRQNLELELQSLKLELVDYRTNIKNITIMKDDEIKLLTDKLNESNKQIPQINKEQNTLVGGFRDNRTYYKSNKGIKPSSNKGIKPSSS
jgi:chromosome segregation ATPase